MADISNSYNLRSSVNSELDSALRKAQRDKKYGVMIVVGNDNCKDCIFLLNHLNTLNSDLYESIFESIVIPVDADGKKLFDSFPPAATLPHIYIVSPIGDLLWSQHSDALKTQGLFDSKKLNRFFNIWKRINDGEGYISTDHLVGGKNDIGPPRCGPRPLTPCSSWPR